jgi:hypothetical protein
MLHKHPDILLVEFCVLFLLLTQLEILLSKQLLQLSDFLPHVPIVLHNLLDIFVLQLNLQFQLFDLLISLLDGLLVNFAPFRTIISYLYFYGGSTSTWDAPYPEPSWYDPMSRMPPNRVQSYSESTYQSETLTNSGEERDYPLSLQSRETWKINSFNTLLIKIIFFSKSSLNDNCSEASYLNYSWSHSDKSVTSFLGIMNCLKSFAKR